MALCGAVVLSSCAVGRDFKRPAAPAAQGYSAQALPEATASAAVAGGDAQHFVMGRDIPFAWWTLFQSPKLDALVDKALKNNPDIAAAEAALRQGQELVKAQYGYFYPTVSAGYDFERQKLPGNLASSSAPGLQGNGQNLQPGAPAQPLIYNFSTAELDVGFTPDVFGANRRKVESLQAQADVLRYQMEATYITLADNVVAAAIQEAALRAQIDATRKFIEQNARAADLLHKQFQLGYAMGIDVATQESALAQAQAQLPPLQKQLEQTHDLIRALVGSLPDEDLDLSFDFTSLQLPQDLPLSLPAKIIEQRPDVRAAEEQLHYANAQVGVAVAAMLPQFSITGSIGGGANQFDNMFSPGGPFWTLVGGVTQPVFEGGTLLHSRRAADQGLLQAAALYRGAVITACQNVADTLHAIQSDGDALAANAKAERAAKKAQDITERQYQLGYVNLLALLSAQETYQQAVVNLVQAQGTRYGDTAALFQALGGGWWNRNETRQAQTGTAAAAVATTD